MACGVHAREIDEATITCALNECLQDFPHIKVLKKEQKTCLVNLARGKDVFAILPTGFGKSLIFQLYPRLVKAFNSQKRTIIVVSPLVSVMRDQVEQLKKLGFSASAIGIGEDVEADEKNVKEGKCEIVFGSPETWLSKSWKKELKDGKLGQQTAVLALDEVHSVTEWGLPEVGNRKKKKNPFREAFGRVMDLRSVLPGVPLLALTASVQIRDRTKLIKACGMLQPLIVDVSPNKENIMFNFISVEKEKEVVTHLKWIATMVSDQGRNSPHTIVFCNTFSDISNILSYLLLELKEKAFTTDASGKRKSLLGVYHAKMWDSQKMIIEEDFKSDGLKRVVIATCALGMGINFPKVRYVVQYGPPLSVVDFMQQAGRGGRDGKQAHCVTYYTKRQLSRCGKDVKMVIKSSECQRQALYDHFSDSVSPLSPSHLCCSSCRLQCVCSSDSQSCVGVTEVFMEKHNEQKLPSSGELTRAMSPEDQNDLKLALLELQSRFSAKTSSFFDATASHGFTDQLVDAIVKNATNIFTFDYLQKKFSIYSTKHAMDVLEVLQELFEDIPDFEQQMELLALLNREVAQVEECLQTMEVDALVLNPSYDSDDDDDLECLLPEFDLQF